MVRKIVVLQKQMDMDQGLAAMLQGCGMEVAGFAAAHELIRELGRITPAAVVVDIDVTRQGDVDVVRQVRLNCGRSLPIVVVLGSECERTIDALMALGVDDIMVRPVTATLLCKRVMLMLRRARVAPLVDQPFVSGPFTLHYGRQAVLCNGEPVALTQKEFDLLWTLLANEDRFLPTAELLATVWGRPAGIETRTVTQHVHMLRKKLRLSELGYQIAAVYGCGYRLQKLTLPRPSVRTVPGAAATADGAPGATFVPAM